VTPDEETARALRATLAERIGALPPPIGTYAAVRRRARRRRHAVLGAAAATVLVGTGVPLGLAGGGPTAPPPDRAVACPALDPANAGPLPAAVPAGELPRPAGVRGSLAADRALVDAVLVTGWQAMRRPGEDEGRTLDPATLRVRFVERAGDAVLGLVTATDRAGRWQVGQWVAGRPGALVPTDSVSLAAEPADGTRGQRYGGADPLVVAVPQVCGRTYAVVLAPPGAAARLTPGVTIGADGRPVARPARTVTLPAGLAVVEVQGAPTVQVIRGSTVLARRSLGGEGGIDPAREPTDADIARAVAAAPGTVDADLAAATVRTASTQVTTATGDRVTGVRVLGGGRGSAGNVVLVALTLPSGATYVTDGAGDGDAVTLSHGGLLPAGELDRTLLAWSDGSTALVWAPGAARLEFEATPHLGTGNAVIGIGLDRGFGSVGLPAGVIPAVFRSYDGGGALLAERRPNTGLLPLPG
jgi:hypothetical protein